MIPQEDLYLKLDALKEVIPKKKWKYYHLTSIENFIFHLGSIKNERSRERMTLEINNYIDVASQRVNDGSRLVDKSKELFASVWELSDLYRYEVGFIKKPDYLIIFLIVLPLFFLLKLSLNTLQALIVAIIGFAAYALYGYFKVKARKVY